MKNTRGMTPQEAILIGHDHRYRIWDGKWMHYSGTHEGVKMEVTGFYDSIMKNIYEGDLVREDDPASVVNGKIGVVIWQWEQARFVVRIGGMVIRFGDYYWVSNSRSTRLAVIGNIYEHPNILDKVTQ